MSQHESGPSKPTQPAPLAPRLKRDIFGCANPNMVDFPSEFKDVPAPRGWTRDESGKQHFAPGNNIAGISRAKKRAIYQKALDEAITPDDIRDIALAVLEKAKKGFLPEAQEIFNRTLGKVTDKIEITDASDGSTWVFNFGVKIPDAPPEAPVIDVKQTNPTDPTKPSEETNDRDKLGV